MVALHNKRLTDSDLHRGVLWNDEDWWRKIDELESQADSEGLTGPEKHFRVVRLMEEYQQTQPSMKQRQQLRKRLWPSTPATPALKLTEEELEYLSFKLCMVNDPIGRSVYAKLLKMAKTP